MNDDELVYRRVFHAPRELVWRCLTEPAELAHLWGPRGMATPIDGIVVELLAKDVRVTGVAGRLAGHVGHHPPHAEVFAVDRLPYRRVEVAHGGQDHVARRCGGAVGRENFRNVAFGWDPHAEVDVRGRRVAGDVVAEPVPLPVAEVLYQSQ